MPLKPSKDFKGKIVSMQLKTDDSAAGEKPTKEETAKDEKEASKKKADEETTAAILFEKTLANTTDKIIHNFTWVNANLVQFAILSGIHFR